MSFDLTAPFQAEFSTRDQMDHRHKVHPVQIFAPHSSDPNRLKFSENALHSVLGHVAIANKKVVVKFVLSIIPLQVVIISVAGVFRKGKSFLLNFFLEYLYSLQKAQQASILITKPNDILLDWLTDDTQLQGFHWRSGAKRDTTGIWMWGEPIMIESANGETYAVVLVGFPNLPTISMSKWAISFELEFRYTQMDTQGTFDSASTYQLSTTVFALSTMLSSMQLYNLADIIQEDSLNNLSLFVEYGRMALSETDQFGPPFQRLVFVVRDFKSPDEFSFGAEGGQQYLDSVIKSTPDQPEELRFVRDQIHSCFQQILCYLLPHPGHRAAERNSFKGHVREEVKKMTSSLLNPHTLQPKVVNGKAINCRKMADFFREYARVFGGSTLPEPRNILNANAQLFFMEAAGEAKTAYIRGMDRACSTSRMMPEKRLYEIHIKHGITALNVFEKYPKIGSGEVRSKILAGLQEELNHELERYKRLNEDKRVTGCTSAMIACGDSVLLGVGLGSAASAAVGGAWLTLQAGMVSAGIVAIPISLGALLAIWTYVYLEPKIRSCVKEDDKQDNT
uniref:GB1/RHD3-type G domain-containing protein n=1 Tax=Ascaris lumbricoides TaxID=6252 RepID=A0A9J2PBS0_ASCLU